MDETPSDQPVPHVEPPLDPPNKIKNSPLLLIAGIILFLLVVSLGVFYFLKNSTFTVQNSNNQNLGTSF